MKSKLTITAKIFNPSVHTTQAGAKLYSFSMGISQQDKKTEQWLNAYLPVTIFDKENQHEWILQSDKKEITIEGQLTIKNGYTKRDGTEVAPHLGVFGFEAYIGKKPQRQTHENEPQAPNAPRQAQSGPQSVSTQPRPSQAQPNMQEPPQGGGEYIDGNGLRQTTLQREENYTDPVAQVTMPDEEIPF